MFETSQQEPSGGSTKLVGGVIVVGIAIMAGVYFAYFRGEAPATSGASAPAAAARPAANTPVPDADHTMDLVITRNNLGRDQTNTMAMWSLQISNRSREITYRDLQYVSTYFDGAGNQIRQGSGVLPGELPPGGVESYSDINDGLYPPTTARYTIEIRAANGFKP